jgi:hypothetical protein
MAAATTWTTGCCSIPTVIDRYIVLIISVHRCVLQWTFEMLERLAGKLARVVLWGGGDVAVTSLPDSNAPAGPDAAQARSELQGLLAAVERKLPSLPEEETEQDIQEAIQAVRSTKA